MYVGNTQRTFDVLQDLFAVPRVNTSLNKIIGEAARQIFLRCKYDSQSQGRMDGYRQFPMDGAKILARGLARKFESSRVSLPNAQNLYHRLEKFLPGVCLNLLVCNDISGYWISHLVDRERAKRKICGGVFLLFLFPFSLRLAFWNDPAVSEELPDAVTFSNSKLMQLNCASTR